MRVSGAMFGFFVDEDGDVIITEEREIAGQLVKATLVPHEAFQDDLPISLIEDHSHWLVEEDGKAFVYFRPVRFDDKEFTKGCSFEGSSYVLDLTSRNIIQTQEKWELIDVRSGTFEELFRVFSRLEDPGSGLDTKDGLKENTCSITAVDSLLTWNSCRRFWRSVPIPAKDAFTFSIDMVKIQWHSCQGWFRWLCVRSGEYGGTEGLSNLFCFPQHGHMSLSLNSFRMQDCNSDKSSVTSMGFQWSSQSVLTSTI